MSSCLQLSGRDPSGHGDSPCELYLGHLRSAESVWRQHQPRLSYTAWTSPSGSGRGDYEAACALPGPWGGGSGQHSSALWQGLCWLSLAAQPGCATVPMGLQQGWDLQCHYNAFAMLLPRLCPPLPATPAPAKGGWRKRSLVCSSLGCSEWEGGFSSLTTQRSAAGGTGESSPLPLGLLLSSTAPKPCSPPSCLPVPQEGLEGRLIFAGIGPCRSQLPGREGG